MSVSEVAASASASESTSKSITCEARRSSEVCTVEHMNTIPDNWSLRDVCLGWLCLCLCRRPITAHAEDAAVVQCVSVTR